MDLRYLSDMMVMISVLIPVYNAKDFLQDSIPSLLNQTFEDFELICVNDGSKDNSLEILNEFASEDSRVKVFDRENGGCGSARNFALEKAIGDYVYFFDPDDELDERALELAYDSAAKNNSDMVVFKANSFDKTGYSNKDIFFNYWDIDKEDYDNVPSEVIRPYALKGGYAPWSKLYKKEFLDSYDDFKFDLAVAFDDVPFHVKSILRAKRISYINKVLYHYRVDNANSVNSTSSNGFDIFRIIDIVEGILKEEGAYEELETDFNRFKANHMLIYILSTDSEEYYEMTKERFHEISKESLEDTVFLKKVNGLFLECETFDEFKPRYEKILLDLEVKKYEVLANRLENEKSRLIEQNKELQNKNKKLEEEKLRVKDENQRLKNEIESLKKEKEEILNSKSWKITKPLRDIKNL